MRGGDRRVVLGLYRSPHQPQTLEAAWELGIRYLDTAFNYFSFASHTTLAKAGPDLIDRFAISTKVGFFPNGEHSLAPERLRQAAEQSATDLRRVPDTLLLHNPEHSLANLEGSRAANLLAGAAQALTDVVASGMARRWGIATWNPGPLTALLKPGHPRPGVLMVRSGLTVGSATLEAAERLATALDLSSDSLWGMSPYAGNAKDPVWSRISPALFLEPGQEASTFQAALAVAYHLPRVSRIAVGTGNMTHLRDLLAATRLTVDTDIVATYRSLIRQRATLTR